MEVSEGDFGELVQGFHGSAVELNVDLLEGLQKLSSSREAHHVFEDDGQNLGVGFSLGELEVHLKRLQKSKGEGVLGLDQLADLGEAVVGGDDQLNSMWLFGEIAAFQFLEQTALCLKEGLQLRSADRNDQSVSNPVVNNLRVGVFVDCLDDL